MNWDFGQLKHRLPRQPNFIALETTQFLSTWWQTNTTLSQKKSLSSDTKLNTTMFLPFSIFDISKKDKTEISVSITKFFVEDLINLNLAIIAVNWKSLKVPNIKKIYNNYKQYYYYKENHLDMMVKKCSNKGTNL